MFLLDHRARPLKTPLAALSVARIALIGAGLSGSAMAAKTEVPLFLFSGQSNMVGLGTNTNDLATEQKKIYANIKIYLDAEGDASRMKKWSTLGPGFGATTTQFGPELFFGKVLADSFPGQKMAFIKVARSGTYLGKSGEWLPPSSNNGTGGTYYTAMMGSIDAALKSFHTAFDTTLYTPKWVGFIWLQGEFDAMDATLSNQYETNLANLVKDIRTKTRSPDLPVILPMIDAQSMWTNNAKIRAADVALTRMLVNIDTVDTKGLSTDGIHYKAGGMVVIGTRSAARWLKMRYWKDTGGIALGTLTPIDAPQVRAWAPHAARFDITGRRLGSTGTNPPPRQTASMVLDQNRNPRLIYSAPKP